MKKRTLHLVVIAMLIVVCLCATTMLTACNKGSTYYLSASSNYWTTYGTGDTVPDDVRFTLSNDGIFTLTTDLNAGDSFVVYKVGSTINVVTSVFSSGKELSMDEDGKVLVGVTGKYNLYIDVDSGEMTYHYTVHSVIDTDVHVTGVTLDSNSMSITVGGADQKLTATVTPANATNKNVSWSTGDDKVATVDNGVVHAVGVGTTFITATTQDGSYQATCGVFVKSANSDNVPVVGIMLSRTSLEMVVGDVDKTISVAINPDNANEQGWSYTIEGNENDIVSETVKDNVITIHAIKAGNVKLVVVSDEDDTIKAECPITVTGNTVEVTQITLDTNQIDVEVGSAEYVGVNVLPSNATDKRWTYELKETADYDVVDVELDDGYVKITAKNVGTATLVISSVSNPDVTAECKITTYVSAVDINSILISSNDQELTVGSDPITLNVVFNPSDTTFRDFTVNVSGDADAIKVEKKGETIVVTPLAKGEASITVSVNTGTKTVTSDPVKITVSEAVVELKGLTIEVEDNGGSNVLEVIGQTLQLKLITDPANYEWTWDDVNLGSANTAVATVDSKGVVTAVAPGSAEITATLGAIEAKITILVRKSVDSIALSVDNAVTLYGIDTTKDITVSFNPSDATNLNYSVTLSAEGIVSYKANGSIITITAIAAGSVTMTVTSVDNPSATASCTITVSTDTAVPDFDSTNITINDIGTVKTITVNNADAVTAITATSASESVVKVTTIDTEAKTITLTSVMYGSTTVSVNISYGGTSVSYTLKVLVASEYFYLVGNFTSSAGWDVQGSSADAKNANVLFTADTETRGIYTITRAFEVGNKFFVVPSVLEENWKYFKANAGYYNSSMSDSSYLTAPDDNVQINTAGNYKVTLDLTGTTAKWYVTLVSLAPQEIVVDSTASKLQVGDTTSAQFSITSILPSSLMSMLDDSTVAWSISYNVGDSWLTYNKLTGPTIIVTLNEDVDLTTQVIAKITVVVTIGDFTIETDVLLTLMPQGATDKPSENVIWESTDKVDIMKDGWSLKLEAYADGTVSSVTYALVADKDGATWTDIYANDDTGTLAFQIKNGVLEATMFGTVWVKATATDGSGVYDIMSVTFYATSFQVQMGWTYDNYVATYFEHEENESETLYEWKNIALEANTAIIVIYSDLGSDWSKGVIRSSGYLDPSSTNAGGTSGSTGASGTSGNYGQFIVTKAGTYNVTLDISGLKPSVKFEYQESAAVTTFTMAVYIVGDVGVGDSSWNDTSSPFASATATLDPTSNNLTVTINTTSTTFSEYRIWGDGIGFVTVKNGGTPSWYSNEVSTDTVALSGSMYAYTTESWTDDLRDKWISGGNCNLKYNSDSTITSTFTFVFTFDTEGILTAISIN